MKPRCELCRYSDTGACHRNPPVVYPAVVGFGPACAFPQVRPDDWCGRFKPSEHGRKVIAEHEAALRREKSIAERQNDTPRESARARNDGLCAHPDCLNLARHDSIYCEHHLDSPTPTG